MDLSISKINPRGCEEIVQRAIALYIIGTYADNLLQHSSARDDARKFAQKFINRYGADRFFSAMERAFLECERPAQADVGFMCWRWESLHLLLWALGFIDEIGLPTQPCDVFVCNRPFARHRTTDAFAAAARMRSADEIAQKMEQIAADSVACDEGVLSGWRSALTWILDVESDWDAITPLPSATNA